MIEEDYYIPEVPMDLDGLTQEDLLLKLMEHRDLSTDDQKLTIDELISEIIYCRAEGLENDIY